MNLQLVTPHSIPVLLRCVRCNGRNFYALTGTDKMYADLDGTPWVAYYCEACAVAAVREQRAPLKLGSTMIEVRIGERSPLLTRSFETFNRGQA
jgi:hypothetical protein